MNDLRRSLMFFYTETPLHAGSGAGLGAIDLPLQRERMSDLPQVHGSGIKGALRELFRAKDEDKEKKLLEVALFGPRAPDPEKEREAQQADNDRDAQAQEHAGALAVTDARLLLMPVRSAHGGWAWITSPLILQRLARDLAHANGKNEQPKWAQLTTDSTKALVSAKGVAIAPNDKLVIEDAVYDIDIQHHAAVAELAEVLGEVALPGSEVYQPLRARLSQQLAIVSDEEMSYWACHGTEVVTRVRIDDATGTVEDGALWTEEALPSESLLWSLVMISDSRQRAERRIKNASAEDLDKEFGDKLAGHPRIFLGGDRTVGRGLVALRRKEGGNGQT